MPEQLIATYINKKRIDAGLTYEAIAIEKNMSESTVKNLCTGKTKNPGIETVMPIMEAIGGSYDEMLFPNKSKDEVKETSLLAMKDIYENQLCALKETSDAHIHNIRQHYEQHHEDLKENYERRLADKRELIDLQNAHILKLEKASKTKTKIIIAMSSIFIVLFFGLLLLEILHSENMVGSGFNSIIS